jgi:uncharacterized membrane protein YwzB
MPPIVLIFFLKNVWWGIQNIGLYFIKKSNLKQKMTATTAQTYKVKKTGGFFS